MPAHYAFQLDSATRSLRVVSSGAWTMAEAEQYAAAFRAYTALARKRFGAARVLVDGRAAATNEPAVSRLLASLSSLVGEPGDRLAVITPGSVRKQQATREGMPATVKAFVSPDAATTWLFAHD